MKLKITRDPIPRDDGPELCVWAGNAKAQSLLHFGSLGVSPGDQTNFMNWCDMVVDACAGYKAASDNTDAWNAYRSELLYGSTTTNTPLTRPTDNTPAAPVLVAPLLPGAMSRIRDMLQGLKRLAAWTAGMEEDFRLVPIVSEVDVDTAKPEAKAKSLGGAQVALSWVRGPFDAVVIEWQLDGAASWNSLGTILGSKFTHNVSLAVPGKPELRHYRIKFVHDNAHVGEWSDTLTVTARP